MTLYCADLFLSISLLFRIVFTRKIQQFEWWNIHEMFAFKRSHNTLRFNKKQRRTGEICVNTFVATKNRSWLINIAFKILISGKFSHSKASFFSFLSTYKWRKSLSRTTLMSEIMDQTDHANHNRGIKMKENIRCTCGTVSTRILQEIYP